MGGMVRWTSKLRKYYYWAGMLTDVIHYVQTCPECLLFARKRIRSDVVVPRMTPLAPWHDVYVDAMGPYRKTTAGNQHLLVCVDHFTRWAEVKAVPAVDEMAFATWLVTELVPRHGCPVRLVSDRGGAFVSGVCQQVYRLLEIRKSTVTAYRPRSNAVVERFNGTFKRILQKYTREEEPMEWDRNLSTSLMAYNTTVSRSTG